MDLPINTLKNQHLPLLYSSEILEGNNEDFERKLVDIVKTYIAYKPLEEIKLKDVRKHVQDITGIVHEKALVKNCLNQVLAANIENEEERVCSQNVTTSNDEDNESSNFVKVKVKSGNMCFLSPALQNVIGVAEESRFQVVALLWKYIKANELQNPLNRREILCDDKLKALFGRNKVTMTRMNTLLTPHVRSKADQCEWSTSTPEKEFDSIVDDSTVHSSKQKKQPKSQTRKKRKSRTDVKTGAKGGFSTQSDLMSPILRDFLAISDDNLPRSQIVKGIWEYIKTHDLQNPDNRREIFCDEAMKKVFRRPLITMFNMNRLLTVHVKSKAQWESGDHQFDYDLLELDDNEWKLKVGDSETTKRKRIKLEAKRNGTQKTRGGFSMEVPLSNELVSFMGGEKAEATRSEVVSHLWQYIRKHNLQNPKNRQQILCDDTLRKLTGQDVVTQFTINRYIQPHFLN